jgi:hypothetical protein
MRRCLLIVGAVMATAALIAPSAVASNAHLVGSPSTDVSGNTLTIKFKLAGLGNVTEAPIDLNGTVDVFSRCFNRGGNTPEADNKQEQIDVNTTETFPVRNGRTNATFTITPLSTLDCPGKQVVRILSVDPDLTVSYLGEELFTID